MSLPRWSSKSVPPPAPGGRQRRGTGVDVDAALQDDLVAVEAERQVVDERRLHEVPGQLQHVRRHQPPRGGHDQRRGILVRVVQPPHADPGALLDDTAVTAPDEELYLRIAADRLDGVLPDRVTESALGRRYRLTAAQLARVLRRISAEGWLERLPGYGWRFRSLPTSQMSCVDSYRFRLLIEPAALLEPGFVLDRAGVERVRAEQTGPAAGGAAAVGNAELFARNREFHETIVACCGNTFFIDALRRTDDLRRLIEYRRSLPRDRAAVRCREHVEIADLLLAGRRAAAAERLRLHLGSVGQEKGG
ncbi:GntR family transcriptional regulator [Amycolatopsis acidiphila]|uniref:GntR family transcriptional regulator n=1 Tax=Amycolatopsis acidiphila TaxID=715473 RepID=A0A558A876_9PSEU|nr:GntR family transcriptional regulator [Amycolatopsis acidiphila]